MPQLRYIDDAGTLRTLTLGTQPTMIGRVSTCDIVFVDDMISREHTRFDRESDGRYRVRDLGSRNKTHVNGQQVNETLLNPGDIIRVGDHVIEYLDPDANRDQLGTDFFTPDNREPEGCEWIKMKAPLTLTLPQIEQLSGLSANWGITSRAEDIADSCLSRIVMDLQAERGFLAMRGDERHTIKPFAHRGMIPPAGTTMMPVSQSFAFAALLQKVAGRYPQSPRSIDMRSGYADTAAVAPLTFREKAIGLIYVDRPSSKQPFTAANVQYLAAAGAVTGAAMAACSRRLSQMVGLEEQAWVSSIRRMHDALFTPPAGNETFAVAHRMFPGTSQRGDFVDAIHLDEQRTLVLVVDAGGQGNTGMAQAMAVRSAFATAAQSHPDEIDLATIFNSVSTMMANCKGRQLVACAAMLCDVAAGRLSYVNAGLIPPVVLVGPGRLVTLDQPSLLLGIDGQYSYEVSSVDLPARFRLVCCTDGATDSANSANESFGEGRIHDHLLEQDAFGSPEKVLSILSDAFVSHIAGNTQVDDATFLVVSRG